MKRNVTLWGKIIKTVGWDISLMPSHAAPGLIRGFSCCDFLYISQCLNARNQCSSIKFDFLEGEDKKLLCPLSPTNGRYQSTLTLIITEPRST